jgi:hypothetical protein
MGLISEILTPSARDESTYDKSVIAIGHVMLGASAAEPVGMYVGPAWLLIMVVYWLIKERGDLKRGGSWRDGIWDAAFVGFGGLYVGAWWWPVAAFAFVAGYLVVEYVLKVLDW